LVRQPDGGLKGYNTDWSAAIAAIERGLQPGTQQSAHAELAGATGLLPVGLLCLAACWP
jgi:shikimate 5-dehydrogenase